MINVNKLMDSMYRKVNAYMQDMCAAPPSNYCWQLHPETKEAIMRSERYQRDHVVMGNRQGWIYGYPMVADPDLSPGYVYFQAWDAEIEVEEIEETSRETSRKAECEYWASGQNEIDPYVWAERCRRMDSEQYGGQADAMSYAWGMDFGSTASVTLTGTTAETIQQLYGLKVTLGELKERVRATAEAAEPSTTEPGGTYIKEPSGVFFWDPLGKSLTAAGTSPYKHEYVCADCGFKGAISTRSVPKAD